jgi:5-(carboxyamino)imidazole ribonucleotide mutase
MPPGVPVACVAVGKMGATNAGWLAAEILALSDEALARRLSEQRAKIVESVAKVNETLPERLRKLLEG